MGVVVDYSFAFYIGHLLYRLVQHLLIIDRSDAVIVDAKPLLLYAVDLLRIEYFDLLNHFVQHPGRQFLGTGILADGSQEHIRRNGITAELVQLLAECLDFFG